MIIAYLKLYGSPPFVSIKNSCGLHLVEGFLCLMDLLTSSSKNVINLIMWNMMTMVLLILKIINYIINYMHHHTLPHFPHHPEFPREKLNMW